MADSEDAEELYFLQAIKHLESQASEKRIKVPKDYFNHFTERGGLKNESN